MSELRTSLLRILLAQGCPHFSALALIVAGLVHRWREEGEKEKANNVHQHDFPLLLQKDRRKYKKSCLPSAVASGRKGLRFSKRKEKNSLDISGRSPAGPRRGTGKLAGWREEKKLTDLVLQTRSWGRGSDSRHFRRSKGPERRVLDGAAQILNSNKKTLDQRNLIAQTQGSNYELS